jgi:SAM-dependent methyltransferase
MSSWNAGYVTDVEYTHGYYTELNPVRMRHALVAQGIEAPEVRTAFELGFGQGLSTNLHAAASTVRWWGNDFNPAQAAFAQAMARDAATGALMLDDAFEQLLARDDLPGFDFIGLHGIWSWISDANRRAIVEFIRRKLNVGGVVYISYNTQPGWAAFVPMRHLIKSHIDRMSVPATTTASRASSALQFAQRLMDTQPVYGLANPLVGERLKKLANQDPHYLAHEYLNQDWAPMPFTEVASWLDEAKLQFAAPGHFTDLVDLVNLKPEQQALLAEVPDIAFRQLVRDFVLNTQFRKDYWVKGLRRMSASEQLQALSALKVQMLSAPADVPHKVQGSQGEMALASALMAPVIEALSDGAVHTLGELAQRTTPQGVPMGHLSQVVSLLIGAGHVVPVANSAGQPGCIESAHRFNHHVLSQARLRGDLSFLASPVTGGGVALNRFEQLFLLARAEGMPGPDEWARFAWSVVAAQGQRLIHQGAPVESAEANLALLTQQAQALQQQRLPLLQRLGLVA